jgi:uncharacterized protein (TIGR03643 family)
LLLFKTLSTVIIGRFIRIEFVKKTEKLKNIAPATVNKIIAWAWDDRKTFDEIKEEFNLSEQNVIDLMRKELKPSSWRMWRKRVTGRLTKHRKRFLDKRRGSKLLNEDELNFLIDES